MTTHIKQTHTDSLLEQVVHTGMGMLTTFLFLYLFFPEIPVITSGIGTIAVTAVKFVIHYSIRRYFTAKRRNLPREQ